MYKIDLHTHSTASPDGGIRMEQYAQALEDGVLDFIAVTDHDTIKAAKELFHSLGERIIIGQEVSTAEGEIIGLYLTKRVKPGQPAYQSAEDIKSQGGIVYVPHPFETVRKGLNEASLNGIAELVDIVEVHNGRAFFQNRGPEATTWARLHGKVVAASSDAHGTKGLGATYTVVTEEPGRDSLTQLLSLGRSITGRPPLRSLLYPKAHRLRKRFGGST